MSEPSAARLANGRPRVLDADLDEYRMDALLMNWARWARGMPDHVACHTMMWPVSSGVEDCDPHTVLPISVDDAQGVEVVLVQMRARRPKLWRAVRMRYIARWTDISAAHQMRVTRDEFRALMLRAYSWVDAMLGKG